jgi:DNA-binding response OmpR family regulator
MANAILQGGRVLIVEDEALVAMTLEIMFEDLGWIRVGPVGRLDEAMRLAQAEPIDAAVLDVNLAGENTESVARTLAERRIPFIVATGYGESDLDGSFRKAPSLAKPFTIDGLTQRMAEALRRMRGDEPRTMP